MYRGALIARKAIGFLERHAATLVAVAVALAVVAASMADTVLAQPPVSRTFEWNTPAIGEMMPDVVVYDRDGAARRLRDLLRERHTVLILGCLT